MKVQSIFKAPTWPPYVLHRCNLKIRIWAKILQCVNLPSFIFPLSTEVFIVLLIDTEFYKEAPLLLLSNLKHSGIPQKHKTKSLKIYAKDLWDKLIN